MYRTHGKCKTITNRHQEASESYFVRKLYATMRFLTEHAPKSPSGRHLGHYKLLVKTHKDKHAKPELHEAADDILQLLVNIMDLACNKGFILECWTKVSNVMIYKNPGVFLINKLRVIHLFKADYNFIIGIIFGR
jgi:hypothetical protein